MSDLGTDVSFDTPDCPAVSGVQLVAEDIAARLECPRGALFTDPLYGYDLRQHIGETLTEAELPGIQFAAANEARKDERVLAASATATIERIGSPRQLRLRLALRFSTAEGPFRLVLEVERLTVRLLGVEPA